MTALGIRLCNPGCLRRSFTVWDGQAEVQNNPEFVTFKAPEWGLRAIVRILDSYQREGIGTIRTAITRWAPPHENPTDQYVANVAKACGVDPDAQLLLSAHREDLVKAIVRQECGDFPYSDETLKHAIELAGDSE